jgi:lysophospholipase L1-like esterase
MPTIIYYGDSMTYGTGGNYPYSHWIAAKTYGGVAITQTTIGLGGNTLTDLYNAADAYINPIFAPRSGMNIIVLWGGINDIFADQGANIQGVLSNLQALASRAREIGFKVIVCTLPANGGGISYATYSDMVRASWPNFADGVADLAANPMIGLYNSYEVYPDLWADDHIHMTDLGYQVAAGIIEVQIDKILNSEPKR